MRDLQKALQKSSKNTAAVYKAQPRFIVSDSILQKTATFLTTLYTLLFSMTLKKVTAFFTVCFTAVQGWLK